MNPSSAAAPESLTAADFDYVLPDATIAQVPLAQRDASRLLHVRADGGLDDHSFADLPGLLAPGDLLVANETRVRAARLHGRRAGGGDAELLVLVPLAAATYACLVRPARRLPEGTEIVIADGFSAVVGAPAAGHPGARSVTFSGPGAVVELIERHGSAPLPPYIRERLGDSERYQTTYATGAPASAAAPTAGLHFTDALRATLSARGVAWATCSLDVGLGTFAPIRADRIDEHVMHEESFVLPDATVDAIAATRRRGGRIVAVGTTSMRVLESCVRDGAVVAQSGSTRLYLTPGCDFRVVDGLVTNFHQPRSSLLVLLAAFIGTQRWRDAYAHALAAEYRFLSFGDAMLCWRQA